MTRDQDELRGEKKPRSTQTAPHQDSNAKAAHQVCPSPPISRDLCSRERCLPVLCSASSRCIWPASSMGSAAPAGVVLAAEMPAHGGW